MMVAKRMIVPAFLMNAHARSHMLRSKSTKRGIRYSGSSMMYGVVSPRNGLVFFSMMPETMIEPIPRKYAIGATHQTPPKNAVEIRAIGGSLAEHGMNVVVMMVSLREDSDSMVREAMMPGTPQPVPMIIGMKVLPDRPKRRKMRSRMKVTRAM